MEIVKELNREFFNQDFSRNCSSSLAEELERCLQMASLYARMENSIAVLSNMRTDRSLICYGGFSRTLGLDAPLGRSEEIASVWEEKILARIHPEDLSAKYLQEHQFFRFIKHQPKTKRADYCLLQKLRMRGRDGNYLPVLHRLFYISSPADNSLWLTLCLYNPLELDLPRSGIVINTVTGQMRELKRPDTLHILSDREREVLALIDNGMTSKGIARQLSISVHTVSRHRQEILCKLQVRNSIEACRIARDLKIL